MKKKFNKYLKKRLNKKEVHDIEIEVTKEITELERAEIDKIAEEVIKKYDSVLRRLAKT